LSNPPGSHAHYGGLGFRRGVHPPPAGRSSFQNCLEAGRTIWFSQRSWAEPFTCSRNRPFGFDVSAEARTSAGIDFGRGRRCLGFHVRDRRYSRPTPTPTHHREVPWRCWSVGCAAGSAGPKLLLAITLRQGVGCPLGLPRRRWCRDRSGQRPRLRSRRAGARLNRPESVIRPIKNVVLGPGRRVPHQVGHLAGPARYCDRIHHHCDNPRTSQAVICLRT